MEPVEQDSIARHPWRRGTVAPDATVLDAIETLEASGSSALVAVDGDDRWVGALYDTDLRRAVLAGIELTAPIRPLLQAPKADGGAAGERSPFAPVPDLDSEGRVIGLAPPAPVRGGMTAVIMAGGRGKRLRPLTDSCPKPMLRVGGKPLLEHTVPMLAGFGFDRLHLCVHYKAEHFREHFGDGSRFGVDIGYVEERRPMGTAGPLGLLPRRPDGPFLVLNGDLLTSVNLTSLIELHRESGAEATMAVCRHDSRSPYGVVEIDGVRVSRIVEKPYLTRFVNAGIYVLEPTVLDLLPIGQRFDMPELFQTLVAAGRPTAAFPIYEYWLDIGWLNDLERASAEYPELVSGRGNWRRFEPSVESDRRFGVS